MQGLLDLATNETILPQRVYRFSLSKPMLMLPADRNHNLNTTVTAIRVSVASPCFGNLVQKLLIESVIGT